MKIKNHQKFKAASLLNIMLYIIIAGIIVGLSVSPLQNMVTKAKQAGAMSLMLIAASIIEYLNSSIHFYQDHLFLI